MNLATKIANRITFMLTMIGVVILFCNSVLAEGDVEINDTYFPDYRFRAYILENIDDDQNGVLSYSEIQNTKDLDVSNLSIVELDGIEFFTELETLNCSYNHLEELDVSKNTKLETLDCSHNSYIAEYTDDFLHHHTFRAAGISKLVLNSSIVSINCYYNALKEFRYKNLSRLVYLDLGNNTFSGTSPTGTGGGTYSRGGLNVVDVSGCENLSYLNCKSNDLNTLILDGCSSLQTLECDQNEITYLYMSNCTKLAADAFSYTNSKLRLLDISNCVKLRNLELNCISLTYLDIKGCKNLESIYCSSGQLDSLDVSGYNKLLSVDCNNVNGSLKVSGCSSLLSLQCRSATAINASGCSKLTTLQCSTSTLNINECVNLGTLNGVNFIKDSRVLKAQKCPWISSLELNNKGLTLLDVSGCTNLTSLNCKSNGLTDINVSGCPNLVSLDCSLNMILDLNISGCNSLLSLNCSWNQIKTLDISNNKSLETFNCSYNNLSGLDASYHSRLKSLNCSNNELKYLYIYGDKSLDNLYCENNQIINLDIDDCPNLITAKTFGTYSLDGNTTKYDYKSKYILSCDKATKFVSVSFGLDKKTANIVCGNTLTLKATLKGSSSKVEWKSSDPKVATVDSSGKINAKMAGMVTITASAAGKTAICKVTILYKDVINSSDFWYVPTNYLTAAGVVKGYDNQTLFKPANECTRAQMLTFMWRLQGSPAPQTKTCKFPDVKPGDYFYKPVIWAVENGITTGYDDGNFKPQNVCTRAQTVTFLWRMANKPAPKTKSSKFTDIKTKDYFYKAVLWASENKIVAGYDDNTFRPQGKCLRRQMVTFLYKYDKYINGKG